MVQRYDAEETFQFIIDYKISYDDLLSTLKKKLSIPIEAQWRIKLLAYNKWIYNDEMNNSLLGMGYLEAGIRIQLEKGQIPISGEFPINLFHKGPVGNDKNMNKTDKQIEKNNIVIEEKKQLITNDTIQDEQITKGCELYGLKTAEYDIWSLNWCNEPIKELRGNKKMIELHVKDGDKLMLQHKSINVLNTTKTFEIFFARSGLPNNSQYICTCSISEITKLIELRGILFSSLQEKVDIEPEIDIKRLKIREYPKIKHPVDLGNNQELGNTKNPENYYPGRVLIDDYKNLKNAKVNVKALFVTQLPELPTYKMEDLHLFLRLRDIKNESYMNYEEFIFIGGRNADFNTLKNAICEYKGITNCVIIKYYLHDWLWKKIPSSCMNIMKAPSFIKSGDVIGYQPIKDGEKIHQIKDDFQTKEDKEKRDQYQSYTTKDPKIIPNIEKNININVNF